MTRSRLAAVFVAILLVVSVAAVPLAGLASAEHQGESDASPTPTPDSGQNGGDSDGTHDGGSNDTEDGGDEPVDVGSGSEEEEDGGPTMSDSIRVSPVSFSSDHARIDTIEEDKKFNVTGNYAVFATNINVQTARVAQSHGDARVMDGDRTIEVTFEEDAAPSSASFYEVELFFEDGSKYVLEMYVKNTDLMVATVDMRSSHDLMLKMERDAADAGYAVDENGVTAVEDYYDDTKETAELLRNLFGPAIKDFQMALIAVGASALAIIILCAAAIFFIRRVKKGHEWKLESLVNSPNLAAIKRQAMEFARLRDRQEAAEHPLDEVPEIGRDYVYWADQYGVYTVKQLADLFHFGQVRFEDGEIVRDDDGTPVMEHEGVDDLLDADRMRDTWLEPAIRDGMLSEEDAIAHGKKATDLMASKFNEPAYRPARLKTRQLLEDLNEGRVYSFGSGNTGTHHVGAGADD